MSLVDTGHHVAARITGIRVGDPLILNDAFGDRGPRWVVYAMVDQVDDSRLPVSTKRTGHGNQADWYVWPISGKVKDMGLYAVKATADEAAAALLAIEQRKRTK